MDNNQEQKLGLFTKLKEKFNKIFSHDNKEEIEELTNIHKGINSDVVLDKEENTASIVDNVEKIEETEEVDKKEEIIKEEKVEKEKIIEPIIEEVKEEQERISKFEDTDTLDLLYLIRDGNINPNEFKEIKNSNIEKWNKELLMIAYYEKNNKDLGMKLVKKLKQEYKEDKDKTKVLNSLYGVISNKKNKFFEALRYEKSFILKEKESKIEPVQEEVINKEEPKIEEAIVEEIVKEPIKEIEKETKKIEKPVIYKKKENNYKNNYRNYHKKNNKKELELSSALAMICADYITLDEIKYLNARYWDKELLMIAYYEKNNKSLGIKLIKELKNKYSDNPKRIKKLNSLTSDLSSKKTKPFDVLKYRDFMGCNFDHELYLKLVEEKMNQKEEIVPEIKEEVKEELNIVKKEIPKKEIKKIKEKSYIGSQGGTTNNRFNNNSSSNKNVNIKYNKQVPTLKEEFSNEFEEIEKYLYVKMQDGHYQTKAVKAWDILENMSDKRIDDKESLEKFIALLRRLEPSNTIKIEIDEYKVKRLLK